MWRQSDEEYKDKCVLPTVKHGGGTVMIWGCMSAAGTGELQFIEGTMNANMYCDQCWAVTSYCYLVTVIILLFAVTSSVTNY